MRMKDGPLKRALLTTVLLLLLGGVIGIAALFFILAEMRYPESLKCVLLLFIPAALLSAYVLGSASHRRMARMARLSGIDEMDGREFEYWCAEYLSQRGFSDVEVTRGSNDYGVDIVASLGDDRYAVQCKRSALPVGNKAVQEVYTGKRMYDCSRAAVLTNSYFSDAAGVTAEKVDVELWDRRWLEDMALKVILRR